MYNKNIIFAYKGNVSDDLFHNLLQLAENKLVQLEINTKLRKRIFNVLVEALQNIYHHIDPIHTNIANLNSIAFLLLKDEQDYFIITGNAISGKQVTNLKHNIDYVNQLNEKQLIDIYREKLSNGKMTEKGGAGLGIIDIARKSRKKIEYEFEKINNDFCYFYMKVKIAT